MARLEFHDDPVAFLAAAGPTLAAEPVLGTVVASVTEGMVDQRAAGLRFRGPYEPWWVVVRDPASRVVGLGMRTAPFAPYPVFLLPMPEEAAAALVEVLHHRGESLGGLNGARPAVDVAAQRWTELTGSPVDIVQHTRLFELGELVVPPAPPGVLRPATAADVELALDWFGRFLAEADAQAGRGPGDRVVEPFTDDAEAMARRIAQGRIWLWENPAGERVHLTAGGPPSFGVARIGPVFTPQEHRGRGYAAAGVAGVSRHFLDLGARVCLFTDQANPTSNEIYRRLGYRPLVDMAMLLTTG